MGEKRTSPAIVVAALAPASAFATRASEPYRRVGTPGQPQFQNGWQNEGSAVGAAFYKDSQGVVHLKGIVTGGAAGDDVFTLPTGYRPAAAKLFPIAVDGAVPGNVEVDGDGTVQPLSTDPTPTISLDGITFRAGS